MTHFIRHQCSWHIRIPNPPPRNEPYGPNLVPQEYCSGKAWNWILGAWNTIICWWANWMGIQQPDRLIRTLMFTFIVDCVEHSMEYSTVIICIEDIHAIQLLLNLSCTVVDHPFVFNDHFQLLRGKMGWWAHIPPLLKFIPMLDISQTSISTQPICVIKWILFTRSELTLIILSDSFPPASSSTTLSFSSDTSKVQIYWLEVGQNYL